MKTIHRLMGVLASSFFVAGHATATPISILPEGTVISGDPVSLLGFDASLNDYIAGGVSAVNDQNIEFLTDDFALAIDFGSDGLLRLWDNLGTGDDLFNYSLRFTFTGLDALSGIENRDVSGLAGGDLLFSVIDSNTFELALHDVQFVPGFSHADLALSVDEPSTLPLFAAGIFFVAGAYTTRRRRPGFGRDAEVAS
jgi:hypothetical protein